MQRSSSTDTDSKPADVFKTFPEFSKLTLGDRKKYEKLIHKYPPMADTSFQALMLLWNTLDSCAVATFNDNLVISYWLPSMEQYSGLSVIGDQAIDETICTVFDYLREKGEEPRLVHVPDFVISRIKHPELFVCKPERDFDEYIFRISDFYPLQNMSEVRRRRVNAFLQSVGEQSVVIKEVDLSDGKNSKLFFECTDKWHITGRPNRRTRLENEAVKNAIANYDLLGISNLGIYIDGVLQGFCLKHRSHDNRYIFTVSARLSPDIPYLIDYGLYAFCRMFTEQGATYINMDYDLGDAFMRTFKLSLGPSGFVHKHTIEPA